MIAGALDEGRQRGSVHQHALLWHMYRVIESAALSETHDLECVGWLGQGWLRSSLQDWLLFIAIAVLSIRHVVDSGEGPDAESGLAPSTARQPRARVNQLIDGDISAISRLAVQPDTSSAQFIETGLSLSSIDWDLTVHHLGRVPSH